MTFSASTLSFSVCLLSQSQSFHSVPPRSLGATFLFFASRQKISANTIRYTNSSARDDQGGSIGPRCAKDGREPRTDVVGGHESFREERPGPSASHGSDPSS